MSRFWTRSLFLTISCINNCVINKLINLTNKYKRKYKLNIFFIVVVSSTENDFKMLKD